MTEYNGYNLVAPRRTEAIVRQVRGEPWVRSLLEELLKKHKFTHDHSVNVGYLAVDIGYEAHVNEIPLLAHAAILHDIGKTCVDPWLLDKNGSLTPAERMIVMTHTEKGESFVHGYGVYLREIVRDHHDYESRKGSQPWVFKLKQIIAAADIYDSLMHPRPYQRPISREEAHALFDAEYNGDESLKVMMHKR